MRPSSSWTDARGARKCVGVGRGDVLPSACAILETCYTILFLSLHALSCVSVSLPSVTTSGLPYTRKQRRGSDAVLGQVYLHSWCLIVVRQGGKARPLRRVVADLYPLFHKRFLQGLTDFLFVISN